MVLVIVSSKIFSMRKRIIFSSIVAAPASVIGIGGDHSALTNEKDEYDHVMSPFHRNYLFDKLNIISFEFLSCRR